MTELSQYHEYIEALDLLDEESRFEYIIDIGKKGDKVNLELLDNKNNKFFVETAVK